MKGITYSIMSGLLAAIASLCGKLSMAVDETKYLCEVLVQFYLEKSNFFVLDLENDLKPLPTSDYFPLCQNFLIAVRLGFFLLMVLSNAVMWMLFTKALCLCSTTIEATLTNTAANFLFTFSLEMPPDQ
ncbi:uncharacterized protein LOC143257446 [Tachypleus tridentatus]|uniref:uncharacterized protein LOC143257446 n=1 Tax=Tachypleus tridentatus TaxID=6853 RepID=UPI003FD03298